MEKIKYIAYKGKGEHSVNELEKIIEQREEELHLIRSGQVYALNPMSETKHTKGPWRITEYGQVYGDETHEYPELICDLPTSFGKSETEKANAKLIAAAPDMLEALKYSLGYIQGYLELQGHEQKVIDNVTEIIKYAIQKAEGK